MSQRIGKPEKAKQIEGWHLIMSEEGRKSPKKLFEELVQLMNEIAEEDNEVDYVAVLDFAEDVQDIEVIRADSTFRSDRRLIDYDHIQVSIQKERESFLWDEYSKDKLVSGTKALYKWCPVGIDKLVVLFVCGSKGLERLFVQTVRKNKPRIEAKLREMEESGRKGG